MDRSWVLDGLENLWISVEALSDNPLVDELALASEDDDDFDRAMALVAAILQASQRVKSYKNGQLFALLNQAFGLEGDVKRRYQLSAVRPRREELVAELGLNDVTEYDWDLSRSIDGLIEELRKMRDKDVSEHCLQ